WYVVVGVLAPARRSDAADFALPDADHVAIVPLAPASMRPALDELVLQFGDEADMARAAAAVQRIVEYGAADTQLEYVMPIELIRQRHRLQRVVAWLLLGMTAVLLTVGGISIANAMLTSVWRRRAE